MNKLFSTLVMALGLAVAPSVLAADASNGGKLAGVCAACHGEDGNSAAPNFPTLAGLGEKYLLKQLKDIKSGSRAITEMTGLLDSLSDDALADLAAYYAGQSMSLSGAKPLEVKLNSGLVVDGLKLGEQVYRAGNLETGVPACTGCHSPKGLGNAPAAYPRIGGQHAQYIEKQLRDFQLGNRTNDAANVMRQVAEHMSDAEIQAVSNYISGLN